MMISDAKIFRKKSDAIETGKLILLLHRVGSVCDKQYLHALRIG
jgi:hypothetical protein